MPALGLSQVLWDERQALAGKPLHFSPAQPPNTTSPDPTQQPPATSPAAAQAPSTPEPMPGTLLDIYRALNADDRWALCLSGGGIRSAAFALGILQRLAALNVTSKREGEKAGSALTQFEYLSTVSGGGYIGSWLSAWLCQERKQRAAAAASAGQTTHARDPDRVVSALNRRYTEDADSSGQLRDHEEAEPISNLRRNTHYLAPSFSPISPDLWSDVAGVLRNLFLNWVLLVPPMILMVLVTKALYYGVIDAHNITDANPSRWFEFLMIVPTLCFIISLSFSAANRPARGWINVPQPWFFVCDLMPFLVGAALLIFVLQSQYGLSTLTAVISASGFKFLEQFARDHLEAAVLSRGAILGAALFFLCWLLAPLWSFILRSTAHQPLGARIKHRWIDLGAWCVAGVAFGVLIAAGLVLLLHFESEPSYSVAAVAGFACVLGLPWIVAARIIADVIYISFAEFLSEVDAGLEFQARASGIFTLAYLGWLLWFGLVLGSPPAAKWISELGSWLVPSLATGGGISGLISVVLGSSSKTKAIAEEATTGLRQYFGLNTIAAIAAAVFAAILVAVLSIVCDLALASFAPGPDHAPWTLVVGAGAVLALLIGAAAHVLSINRYSLHSIYRNRLVRAFLGASRHESDRDQTKNAFTDFDSRDSPRLHELWEHGVKPLGTNWKPLHVISAALNLVSSKNLAWQERMAAPFTFSPLHCGSGSAIFSDGAYRTTYATTGQPQPYGGRLGLTLGTAMAISGAAVSPNMGYNSSPGVAFLMTLFNVRLGWWLANPRGDNPYYSEVKPRNALRPFFMEMFGLTSETERWVYLSDGGHFENLGLYEMVRRRCRVIVVSDAGCDPDYSFEDLGNALRKVWIDLGVRIDLHGLDRLKKRFKERPSPAPEEPYWAIGDILYHESDGGDSRNGLLLYFKSGLHGSEPIGVLSYAISHVSFPHETTLNQFFTESQFESYRMLGYEIAERAFESGGAVSIDVATKAEPTFVSIIEKLKG
ncbi:patatin-like phospholipase family protein [Bradyrhizobium sp. CCGUVB1N3]|uniref:patatin-like phospholipase family protein n=1 Tax=Bradyrhizobium sp. CCGUVB1N3 TaxID=2949629 RepID=UPI0020B32F9A|nr:patatin-like phospholipase family protein [Bradyrhizobium sp. CCGUVB1N3]MCP3471561.1 patatin-like phospholipase family protein [Bradyrhizobium sp. CCGUVB1N3]